ncbi:hypothetical protein Sjap_025235 [Stephania japonica]|uniref:Aminotransferase-like plant mobile domain-containing protein n=1 Tax=Stephania japonica TaxID=461633 RepID=A0AAP0HFE4_9MAGN
MAKSKSRRSESLPKIEFSGWRDPQKKWKQWVDRLTPKNSQIWEKSGISQAIKASTYKIKRDEAVIVGLSEYWAPSTNSFEFNFGAATITLEDLMGLGGYSVFGEPVSLTVPEKLLGMQCQITQKHKWFYNNTSNRNPSFSCWMSHFMEECEGEEIEHIGFLVLWLSRFVFPSNGDFVSRNVFSIAVHLANETRIALGPAVLPSIYGDLRTLSDFVSNGPKGHGLLPCTVYVPMQLVQLWAWEKFVLLSPYVARKTSDGDTWRQSGKGSNPR